MNCSECGEPAEYDHHVVPKIRGGTNTGPLCGLCHGKVHDVKKMTTAALTKEALQKRKQKGLRVSRHRFGWDVAPDGKTMIENPLEQSAIRLMMRLRWRGKSLPKIAERLTAMGVVTKVGKPWHFSTVDYILKSVRVAKGNKYKSLPTFLLGTATPNRVPIIVPAHQQ
jgi:hypothetical protein